MGVGVAIGRVGVTGGISLTDIQTNNSDIYKGTVSGITSGTQTTVITIPANGPVYITKIICSGEENGKWELYKNAVWFSTKRTVDRQVDFDFNLPYKLAEGDILDLKVTHNGVGATASFEATIFGYTVNLPLETDTLAQWKFNETP